MCFLSFGFGSDLTRLSQNWGVGCHEFLTPWVLSNEPSFQGTLSHLPAFYNKQK